MYSLQFYISTSYSSVKGSYPLIKGLVLSTPSYCLRGKISWGPLFPLHTTRVGKTRDAIICKFGVDGVLNLQGPDEDIV